MSNSINQSSFDAKKKNLIISVFVIWSAIKSDECELLRNDNQSVANLLIYMFRSFWFNPVFKDVSIWDIIHDTLLF